MIGSLVLDVERFVRWVYPGLLLLAFLQFGREDGLIKMLDLLDEKSGTVRVFVLGLVAIVFSFGAYTVYRYIFHQLVQWLFFLSGFSDVLEFARGRGVGRNWEASGFRKRGVRAFSRWSNAFELVSRSGSKYRGYMGFNDYVWGLSHAIGVTWLMLIALAFCVESSSRIGRVENWKVWWVGLIVILVVAWVWVVLRNVDRSILFARSLEGVGLDNSLWTRGEGQ